MPFHSDESLVEEFGNAYGKYVSTFESEHGQVSCSTYSSATAALRHTSRFSRESSLTTSRIGTLVTSGITRATRDSRTVCK